jgi:hypothetical protein
MSLRIRGASSSPRTVAGGRGAAEGRPIIEKPSPRYWVNTLGGSLSLAFGAARTKARVEKKETGMSDYVAMFSALAGYGVFFYFFWTMQ